MLDLDEEAKKEIKPSEFLKEKVMTQITSVQVFVFGNMTKDQAVEFCKENIVKKLNTVDSYTEEKSCSTKLGCIYT